jgi:hypothetical protein
MQHIRWFVRLWFWCIVAGCLIGLLSLVAHGEPRHTTVLWTEEFISDSRSTARTVTKVQIDGLCYLVFEKTNIAGVAVVLVRLPVLGAVRRWK